MRKAFTDKILLLTLLLAVTIAVSSFIMLQKTEAPQKGNGDRCHRARPAIESFWEAFPRQLVSAVLFR